jgi:hypothetical protein
MRITEEEFDRELHYQTVMHFLRIMLLKGMISENEFFQVEILNRERYKPLIGILLSGKFLLRSTGRIDAFISRKTENQLRNVLSYNILKKSLINN